MVFGEEILYECVRKLMFQVREEQSFREALIHTLAVTQAKPVQVPTDAEVDQRIEELK